MPDAYIGEINVFAFNYAPEGWESCDGRALRIADHQALYALIGTTYGGDGVTTFNLPDLRSRTMLHRGASRPLGRPGGAEISASGQIPKHAHALFASADPGSTNDPAGALPAALAIGSEATGSYFAYAANPVEKQLSAEALAPAGSSAAHDNMQPSLTVNFCIAVTGRYPARG